MSDDLTQRINAEAQRIAKEWGPSLRDTVERNVRAKGVVDEGSFADSIAQTTTDEGLLKARTELSFSTHGRMADMGAGNMYKLGQYMGREERTDLLTGRKGNKAYSKAAYGRIGSLTNLLANMYVEEVPTGIKHILEDERTG